MPAPPRQLKSRNVLLVRGSNICFEDTCDVDAVGDEAIRELTPKRLKTYESRSLALVTQSDVRTVMDVPTSVTTVAATTVVPPLPLSGVAQSLSATIPF